MGMAELYSFYQNHTLVALLLTSMFMSLLTSLIYRFYGNYKEMRRIKAEINDLKDKLNKARKEKDDKKLMKYMKRQNELAMEQFQYMFKPMTMTMLVVGFVFYFLRHIFLKIDVSFALPFYIPWIGNEVGWLGFYIIMSLPMTVFFRKLMKLD